LLEKRPPAGIWGGLWCLPEADDSAQLAQRFGLSADSFEELPQLEHRLTHRRLLLTPLALCSEAQGLKISDTARLEWFDSEALQGLGLPRPVEQLLGRVNGRINIIQERKT
jgi:A/G-specific adenine glycosylase